jgi:hypothetical protein
MNDAWVPIGKTHVAKYSQLAHLRERGAANIAAHVSALGLERFDAAVRLVLSAPPYSGSHVLITDLEPDGGYFDMFPHLSIAVEMRLARDVARVPLLQDAWRYLVGTTPVSGP